MFSASCSEILVAPLFDLQLSSVVWTKQSKKAKLLNAKNSILKERVKLSMLALLLDVMASICSRTLNVLVSYLLIRILAISCKPCRTKTSLLLILIQTVLRNNYYQTTSQNYIPLVQANRLGSFHSSILTVGLVLGLSRYASRTSNTLPMSVSQPET